MTPQVVYKVVAGQMVLSVHRYRFMAHVSAFLSGKWNSYVVMDYR